MYLIFILLFAIFLSMTAFTLKSIILIPPIIGCPLTIVPHTFLFQYFIYYQSNFSSMFQWYLYSFLISSCRYAFSLNIFNLSILGTSCLIKSAFVSSKLISTTKSSAETKSLIFGVFRLFLFHFSIGMLSFQTVPY